MSWKMYGVHPIRGVDEATRYVENVREFPPLIKIWMRTARLAGFLLIVDTAIIVTYVIGIFVLNMNKVGATASIAGAFLLVYDLYAIVYKTRFDVFTPIGFHLFRWTITVRA